MNSSRSSSSSSSSNSRHSSSSSSRCCSSSSGSSSSGGSCGGVGSKSRDRILLYIEGDDCIPLYTHKYNFSSVDEIQ